jgi:hypothetical protein
MCDRRAEQFGQRLAAAALALRRFGSADQDFLLAIALAADEFEEGHGFRVQGSVFRREAARGASRGLEGFRTNATQPRRYASPVRNQRSSGRRRISLATMICLTPAGVLSEL